MNCRIIETAKADLLIFRDLDEDSNKVISFQVYGQDGTIAKQSLVVDHQTIEEISQGIQGITPQQAEQTVNVLLAMIDGPLMQS